MPFTRIADRQKKKREDNLQEFQESEQFLSKIKSVFGSKHGPDVLNWILEICNVNDSVFTGNSETYYRSGQQDLGNLILEKVMKADINIYLRLVSKWKADMEAAKVQTMQDLGIMHSKNK